MMLKATVRGIKSRKFLLIWGKSVKTYLKSLSQTKKLFVLLSLRQNNSRLGYLI